MIPENFENPTEQMYLEEYKRHCEAEYWEWYEKTEGTVIIKNEDGTETEITENLPKYILPF